MQGIERNYCDVCINALVGAWRGLMDASGAEAIGRSRYGKGAGGDTLGLDVITETIIRRRLEAFDQNAFLITEELDVQAHRRWPTDSDPERQPLMFFCDPTDRSAQLLVFIQELTKTDPLIKVGQAFSLIDPEKEWNRMFEAPAIITGSSSAITCVRKGKVVFSVILNFISGTIYVATDIGIFSYKLKSYTDPKCERLTLAEIKRRGNVLRFPGVCELRYSHDDCRRFVTFLGKSGYKENLQDADLFFTEEPDAHIHHREPPGPPRVLYLSALQNGHGPVGFILSNGEKIGEWMHWLSFIKFARNEEGGQALRAFEIALERPWTKNGMLMSTSLPYSIFFEGNLDISRLRNFERPSQFRCMLLVIPYNNERLIHVLEQHQYREVTDCF